jgi:hypothetical protein
LLPISGAKRYRFQSGAWKLVYADLLTSIDRPHVNHALTPAAQACDLSGGILWGDVIEDRGSQITFSGLGQRAPLDAKQAWDSHFAKRKRLQTALVPLVPDLAVSIGGSTSIDVTKAGTDNGYGIIKLASAIALPIEEMMFVGDARVAGGNDHSMHAVGMENSRDHNVAETKCMTRALLMFAR